MRNQNIPRVIVSPDRDFLEPVCTKIVDAEGGVCTEYQGNYSRFLQLKKGECSHAWDVIIVKGTSSDHSFSTHL